jgi:hypothetical protein
MLAKIVGKGSVNTLSSQEGLPQIPIHQRTKGTHRVHFSWHFFYLKKEGLTLVYNRYS